jgi:hypothetical protein
MHKIESANFPVLTDYMLSFNFLYCTPRKQADKMSNDAASQLITQKLSP